MDRRNSKEIRSQLSKKLFYLGLKTVTRESFAACVLCPSMSGCEMAAVS